MKTERDLVDGFPGTVHRIGEGRAWVALVDAPHTLLLLAAGEHALNRKTVAGARMESKQWVVTVVEPASIVVAGDYFTNPTDVVRAGDDALREPLLHPNDRARQEHVTRGRVALHDGDALAHHYATWRVCLLA
jgi:hypothetical protein